MHDFFNDILHLINHNYIGSVEKNEFKTPFQSIILPEKNLKFRLFSPELENENYLTLIDESIEHFKNINIWKDQWQAKAHIISNRIKSLLGVNKRIFARQSRVTTIDQITSANLLEKFHLQGSTKCKFRLALEHNQKYIALMTFSQGREIMRNGEKYISYELIRFCNTSEFNVTGGMGKLVSAFENQIMPDDIMSYVDRDWSDGIAYQKLGFSLIGTTIPQCFWLHKQNGKRCNPEKLLAEFRKKNYGTTITTQELFDPAVYYEVYNAGNLKYVKFIKNKGTMTTEEFKLSIEANKKPLNISRYLEALWEDAKGNWEKAHELVQDDSSEKGSHIHAYLHRKEGDLSNAGYWYRRAGKSTPTSSLEQEWQNILETYIND